MFDAELYYNNKALLLPKETQEKILRYMNRLQSLVNMAWRDHYAAKQAGDTLKAESQLKFYYARLNALTGAKYLLEELGIMVEYDWEGSNRGKWFFPDYNTALDHEDFLIQCAD